MSDELMIQGVNPQIQPQRVSAMPYVLGGAALGGVGAYAATSLKKGEGAKSYEELIQKANDADKVELTAKKEAVEKAEKELAEAGKAVYEGAEKDALDKAIQARDAELAKLTETTTTGSKIYTPRSWDKFEKDLDLTKLSRNERLGKDFTMAHGVPVLSEVQAEYKVLIDNYNNAVADLESRLRLHDKADLDKVTKQIDTYLADSFAATRRTAAKDIDTIFATEEQNIPKAMKKPSVRRFLPKHLQMYLQADDVANSVLKDLKVAADLSDEQIMSFAEKSETKPKVSSTLYRSIKEDIGGGRTKRVYYSWTPESLKDFITEENKGLVAKRNDLRTSLLEKAKENYILQRKLLTFDPDFIETVSDTLAKDTKKLTGAGKLDIASLIAEAGGIDTKTQLLKNPAFYQRDLQIVNSAIKSAKNGADCTTIPTKITGKYGTVKNLGELKKIIEARDTVIREMYHRDLKSLVNDINAGVTDHTIVKELEEKVAATREADEGVKKALEAIRNQFPGEAEGIVEKAGLTTEQAMEKDSYKKLAEAVEKAQAAYDKVAAEKGKVNEGAKKAAEDTLSKAKGELDKLVSDLGGKVGGMSNKAKLAWAAGTAVVGGLIGSSIANSKNKKIEEAAQNLYA